MKTSIALTLIAIFALPTNSSAVESCISSCETLTRCAQDSRDALNEARQERANVKSQNKSSASQKNTKNLAKSKNSQTDPMKRAAESTSDCKTVGETCANGLKGVLTKIQGISEDLNHGLSQIQNCMSDKRFAPTAQNIQQEIQQMIQLSQQEETATKQEIQSCQTAQSKCSSLSTTNNNNADKMKSEEEKKDEKSGGGGGGGGSPPGGAKPEPKPKVPVDCGKPENANKSECVALYCAMPEYAGNPKCASFCLKPENSSKAGCKILPSQKNMNGTISPIQ